MVAEIKTDASQNATSSTEPRPSRSLNCSWEIEIKPIGNTNNDENLTNIAVEKLSKADT